jgi:hypothetical protein
MPFPIHRSPNLAVLLVCGCTLVSLCWFQYRAWYVEPARKPDATEQWIAKYAPLRPLLPRDEPTRFVVDADHLNNARMHPEGRLYLAQFAVSPRLLGDCRLSRWVVVESDSPETPAEIAARSHWTPVADLCNGVRLYRTDGKE